MTIPAGGLRSGKQIGPYRIDARIGAGGMGEVYRAHDLKLGRDVAIKVLPASAASDPDRIARLEREARLLATLNHPNIAAIYGLEAAEGVLALVLELVDGPTLADRIAAGPLRVREALHIAGQIAEAFDVAHGKGIIHRDLKPANIKVTPDGRVKVLDFGLAKAFSSGSANGDSPLPQTVTIAATQEGMIVGTAGYMSPEQARGLPVDKRTDIWAFGCVLYEMLTGAMPFAGATLSDTIAAVLEREPDWRALPRTTPVRIQQLLRRCLEKDLKRRLRDIGDAALELQSDQSVDAVVELTPRSLLKRGMLIPAILGLVGLTALITTLVSGRAVQMTAAPLPIRFSIPPPSGTRFGSTLADVETTYLALSPDGSQLAFVATDPAGQSAIWIRPLAALEARRLAGTDGAISTFWSPDGRALGFFAGGKLKRVDLPDGRPVSLGDVPTGAGMSGTWGANGDILYASVMGTEIWRATTAGTPRVSLIKATGKESRLYWPRFLPDGRRFLYVVRHDDGTEDVRLSEPGRPPRSVTAAISNVEWVDPGYLVFASEGTLLAQRFDLGSSRGTGVPFAIADPIDYVYMPSRAQFTTSQNGAIAYQAHRDLSRLAWIDRTGEELETVGEPGGYFQVRLSPDGKRVLFSSTDRQFGTLDLWSLELARRVPTRLTSDPRMETTGVWLPDGNTIVFTAARRTMPNLFERNLATGKERELLPPGRFQMAIDVTRDGKLLLFSQRSERGDSDLFTMPLDAGAPPSPLLATPFKEHDARLSLDGRAIAFESNESGRPEVYVAPFPITEMPTRVSSGGGSQPRWNRNGQELFYIAADARMMNVPIRSAPTLVVGTPRPLFTFHGRRWGDFDVSIDGEKFLAIVPDLVAREQPVTVVVNWPAEIKQEVRQLK